jgi:hypothetical protein
MSSERLQQVVITANECCGLSPESQVLPSRGCRRAQATGIYPQVREDKALSLPLVSAYLRQAADIASLGSLFDAIFNTTRITHIRSHVADEAVTVGHLDRRQRPCVDDCIFTDQAIEE